MGSDRTILIERASRQSGEEPGIPVAEADLDDLPAPAAAAWRSLPEKGNVTLRLAPEDADRYYDELVGWAARAGVGDRWRFLYRDVYYEQSELAHGGGSG